MNKFEIGKVYADSNGKEYRVIGRTEKSVVLEDVEKPGNSLYQIRKTFHVHSCGSEYIEMVKGKSATYRNHKKSVGRYQTSSGRKAITIQA